MSSTLSRITSILQSDFFASDSGGSFMKRSLLRVFAIEAALIALLFPYEATYSPGTNVWRGPLWELRAYTTADVVLGVVVILICMGMLGIFLIQPTWRRFPWVIAASALWIGFGLFASYVNIL